MATVISPLPVKLAKITVIVIFLCFAECAAGSCLSYGHACWGAHGKRNNNVPNPTNKGSQWFLSKLVHNPIDLPYISERDSDLFAGPQLETLKSQDDSSNLPGGYLNEENMLFDDIYSNERQFNKMKIPKLLGRIVKRNALRRI